ncbi:hypothetical protein [Tautonia sociabilis]|uniref:Uncharacterized protein n=1 Tax=Tautonia sociabilis TaxID=2080755 RepID=A0A432MET8_9BACT|nr:hypothetical protein [Tautonia sociabilis]RUL84186.1 hypothetical protein TsocGM_20900 [Tautonia sociabilis]
MSTPRRFRPGTWDPLEERVVLSTGLRVPLDRAALIDRYRELAAQRAAARQLPSLPASVSRPALVARPAPRGLNTPEAVINQQYASYAADVSHAVDLYFGSLSENPSNTAVLDDVGRQYLSYISQRTLSLSRDLVSYFNRLPIRLPRVPGNYYTERPETAIQLYIANQIAGQGPQLLLAQLLALPLPSSTGNAVDLYQDTVSSIIESSRQQIREGVRLLFAGRSVVGVGLLTPAIPAQP